MRRFKGISFVLSVFLLLPFKALGKETPTGQTTQENQSVEHVEIHLPAKLLPGLPAVDESLTMEESVHLGLQNNLNIQVAGAETEIRQALLKEARGKRWPVLSLGSLTFLRGGNNLTLMTPDIMMNTVDSTLFQDLNATGRIPLFTGGQIRGSIRAARFNLAEAQASLRQAAVQMAYQVREAYLRALLAQAEHLTHRQHLIVQKELLRIAEARYRVGRGLRADVLRIQTELANTQQMLNEEHNRLNLALYDLKAAMGVDLGSDIALTETLTFMPWSGPSLPSSVQSAITTHPRIQESQQRILAAEAQIKIARATYLPQVYGQVTGNLRFPDRPLEMGNGVIGMVTASLPVFDRTRDARLEQAHASLKRAQQELKALQLEIGKEIAKAWSELEFARQNVTLADSVITQAQEDLRLMQRRFAVGRAIQVEVQDAALTLREAQLNRNRAAFNHELAKARLLQATGKV